MTSAQKRWEPRELPRVKSVLEAVTLADVAHHARYQPEDGQTFCNIFVWDVTRALLGEAECAPHWVGEGNAPCPMGRGRELSANALCVWLRTAGPTFGWHHAGAAEAHVAAMHGEVALATWENPGGHGHVAVVLPNPNEIRVAQAGKTCFMDGSLTKGFGSKLVNFYVHAMPG